MKKNILITGMPRSGKSTLLEAIVRDVHDKVGFITKEIRREGERTGFQMINHLNATAVLCDIDRETAHKVSRYFVDTDALEAFFPAVSTFSSDDLLYLDEIGQMQLLSEKFKELVLLYLNAPNPCLATISCVFDDEFTRNIKVRDDVVLVAILEGDREEKGVLIMDLLKRLI